MRDFGHSRKKSTEWDEKLGLLTKQIGKSEEIGIWEYYVVIMTGGSTSLCRKHIVMQETHCLGTL
ncbi:hypothetical protein BH18THE2_BH18THE2_31050 [soil metagenome]